MHWKQLLELICKQPRCARVHLRSFDTRLSSKKEMREKKTGTTLTHAPASASCSEIRKLSDLLSAAHAVALQRYMFLSLFFLPLLDVLPSAHRKLADMEVSLLGFRRVT